MNIWITGCAGFLGTRLTRELSAPGVNLVGLSRRPSLAANHSITTDLAEKTSTESIRQAIASIGAPDVVIHAASKQPGPGSFPEFVKSNVSTTANLLDGLRATPPRQIIYTSTLSVYPRSENLPINERYPASSPIPYAATKRWAEQLLETFRESQVIVLRLPSLYGAGQADSFIDGLAQLALRNEKIELFARGQLIRDALHVNDVTAAIRTCIESPPSMIFCRMNLGCGRPITTLEYAQALVDSMDSKSEIVASDRASLLFDGYADIEVARGLIGFQPTELRESMRNYADELRA